MSRFLVTGRSPEEQEKLLGRMYLLLGDQVRRYHRHYHMGENSSVPVELARELMESVEYTLSLVGGVPINGDLEKAFRAGQAVLTDCVRQARSLMDLVTAMAPPWQTECRWEALACLKRYLDGYDPLHLAHRGPDELFYPILIREPENIRGIQKALFYLNIMWVENRIMAGAGEMDALWDRLPRDALNQCEQLLNNGIGKALLGTDLWEPVFREEEHMALAHILRDKSPEELRLALDAAASRLCCWLELTDGNTAAYVAAAAAQLSSRLDPKGLRGLFL